jgi:type IV pilus assembly protein PilY1
MKHVNKLTSAVIGTLAALAANPVFADDSEVFTNPSFTGTTIRPNVLFILDTSGSMDTEVNVYDPAQTYLGPCPAGRVYWQTADTEVPPLCTSNQWVSVNNNRCQSAATGMANDGWWRGRTQMLISGGNPSFWANAVASRDAKLECGNDRGVHGDLPGTTAPGGENKYARNGTGSTDASRWGNSGSSNQLNWGNLQRLSLYSSNYANWWYAAGGSTPRTRLQIVRDAAKNLIDNLDGVNLGIMRYSTNAQGGMVRYPISELTATSRAAMKAELDSYLAEGFTPLSETLYEAHQYLSGGRVAFGNSSTGNGGATSLSVPGSRVGGLATSQFYDSPMDESCQSTYIVYLTDGLPTSDNAADAAIQALPDFATDGGGPCPAQIPIPDPSHLTSGRCLENLSRYLNNHDLRPTVVGEQTVISYYIGFGSDIAASEQFLQDVAAAGGGRAYTAADSAGLAATLEEIFNEVQEGADTTFVSPAVSVNAFNRAQNLNDLFVSVFAPSRNFHWAGNVKKYRIIDGEIFGWDTTTPAVDENTGFFHQDAKALNTPSGDPADGPNARLGGSAARLPGWQPGERDLYTYLGMSNNLTSPVNAVEWGNIALTAGMIGASDAAERQAFIEFARGRDLTDEDADQDVDELRKRMGDPMHAKPAIAIHGGTALNPIGTVFTTTNDGYLHAFDMTTGDELWAFIPAEFLSRIEQLFGNAPTANRNYSLDGDVRVFKYDVDQDGIVEAADGDKVYLFFGTRRGGSIYYSLDVTDRENPAFRWKKTNLDLPTLGQAWSTPEIARVNIAGAAQNSQKFVLIFGGGYDPVQEGYNFTTDSVGNSIFMLDLETGALLWRAGGLGTGANFEHDQMRHSIPSGITVLDTDADFFADRMYAADIGGRIWRFDIWNGNGASSLVTGGVLASLGGAANTNTPTENRRFYNSPDVAPVSSRGSRPFFNIAIGSGYRGHPLHKGATAAQDRFYSIRDYRPWSKRTQADYNSATVILDSHLLDLTEVVCEPVNDGALGWKIQLREGAGQWRGEKVLGDSTTAGGVIFFSTFTPLDPDPTQPCMARTLNRAWAVRLANACPFTNWEGGIGDPNEQGTEREHRYQQLAQSGIAPSVQVLPGEICQVGAHIMNRCVKFDTAIRSFWEHRE